MPEPVETDDIRKHRRIRPAITAGALAVLFAGSSGGVASAAARPAALNLTASKPAGYSIEDASFTVPAGVDRGASVGCPVSKGGIQTWPQGGGVLVSSTSLAINIADTYPDGTFWVVNVNNASSEQTVAGVYAVCAKPFGGYAQVESTTIGDGTDDVEYGSVSCPHGTKALGGGVSSPDPDLNENVAVSFTNSPSDWLGGMSNSGTGDDFFNIWAVCSKYSLKSHYTIVQGPATTVDEGTQTDIAPAVCPAGTSVLGGGVGGVGGAYGIGPVFPSEVLGSDWPSSASQWEAVGNNFTGETYGLTSYAICAS